MPMLAEHLLSTTFAEPGVTMQALGENVDATLYPTGRPGTFDLVNGITRITVKETDPITYTYQRAELVFKHQLDVTGERWYTWEIMVPSGWDFLTGFTVMQVHVDPEPEEAIQSRALNFILMLENNEWTPLIPVAIDPISTIAYRPAAVAMEFDRWYSMCLHANWQTDNTGFIEFYIDKVPLFKRTGLATTYSHPTQGPYSKLGLYNHRVATGWTQKVAYYRNARIWSANDGYQAVMGGAPIAPPRFLVP